MEFKDNRYLQYNPIPLHALSDEKMAGAGYDAVVVSSVGEGPVGPAGPAGDTIDFDDLTDAQIARIYRNASTVTNVSIDHTITTSGASTQTIPIGVPSFDRFDMLFVDVNGLDLSENDDYTINYNDPPSIVLSEPLPAGQEVHFRVIRYDITDGDKTINVTTADAKSYGTVAQMQADSAAIEAGDICHVLGGETAGDGKGCWYLIKNTGTADGSSVVRVGTLYAHRMYRDDLDEYRSTTEDWERAKDFLLKGHMRWRSSWMLTPYKRDDGTSPIFIPTQSTTKNYFPVVYYTHGTGVMTIQGEFQTVDEITPIVDRGSSDGKEPVFISEYCPAKSMTLRFCLQFVRNGALATAGLRIEPSGYVYIVDDVATGIPANTVCRIDDIHHAATAEGDFNMPWITKADGQNAANWAIAHMGWFYYGNGLIGRLNPVAKPKGEGFTDCSGMVYCAYKFGAGKKIPTAGGAQGGCGRLISFANSGEKLDLSKAIPGDIVLMCGARSNVAKHVLLYVGNGVLLEENTAYPNIDNVPVNGNGDPLGPQPLYNPEGARQSQRFLVRIIESPGIGDTTE